MTKPRGRGRPKGGSDSCSRILAPAIEDFGEHGYESATVRSIAARSGVDSALVHHYFGTKADLFAEAAVQVGGLRVRRARRTVFDGIDLECPAA